ncbi:hypothetical protein M569_08354, partial [Genlisea aurea]
RSQGLSSWTAVRIRPGKSEICRCPENYIGTQEKPSGRFMSTATFYSRCLSTSHGFKVGNLSSEASAESGGEKNDDLERHELFSWPGGVEETTLENGSDDIVSSKSEADFFEQEPMDDDVLDNKSSNPGTCILAAVVLDALPGSVKHSLDEWVKEEGNKVNNAEVLRTMRCLRRRKLFSKALQLCEWLESNDHVEFSESTYAGHLDLIGKVYGVQKAEEYIQCIPESFRGELVYRSLLTNAVIVKNVKKAEEVFNRMKQLGFPISCFTCNQLLLLYRKNNRRKLANVLVMMERQNVKPSLLTYQILIDAKGRMNDIVGMEQTLEAMKAEGMTPSIQIMASLAKHYADSGSEDKAEKVLKELEGDDLNSNREVCHLLLPVYASLGREDEVGRIWEVCESDPRSDECTAAIEAWGRLHRIENAEAAFEKAASKNPPSSKHFTVLLKAYASHHGLLDKGEALVKRMGETTGCTIGPLAWHALVKLYVDAGEAEKAYGVLDAAVKEKKQKKKKGRALHSSFVCLMDHYAKRGDVHNAERVCHMLKQSGYAPQIGQYQALLEAYINAKAPAYGFRDRMRADKVYPNRVVAAQLARIDAF